MLSSAIRAQARYMQAFNLIIIIIIIISEEINYLFINLILIQRALTNLGKKVMGSEGLSLGLALCDVVNVP